MFLHNVNISSYLKSYTFVNKYKTKFSFAHRTKPPGRSSIDKRIASGRIPLYLIVCACMCIYGVKVSKTKELLHPCKSQKHVIAQFIQNYRYYHM